MATIDLHGGDAQRVRGQYRTSLGRDAADHEVEGWLSGRHGGGNIDNWLQQIDSSHEAQQRRQPQTVGQPNPNVSTPQTPSAPSPTPTVPTNPHSGYPDYSQWYPEVDAW